MSSSMTLLAIVSIMALIICGIIAIGVVVGPIVVLILIIKLADKDKKK